MIAITLLKVTVLLSLAWALALALRNRSAATRHFVWCAALFGSLAIGVVTFVAPPLKVPVPMQKVETIIGVAAPALSGAEVSRAATGAGGAGRRPVSRRDGGAPLLPLLWLAGFASVVVWSVVGHMTLARVAKRATPADGFRISDEISAPVTCGWRKPIILLPRESTEWPDERRRAALLHERAHAARADFLTQTFARLAAAVYWFHPLVWVAWHRMRAESEHACDDRVLRDGMPASDYASHLLAVAHGALSRRHGAIAAVAMARPSQLESRLVALLDEHRSRGFLSRRTVVSAALVIAVVLIPIASARPEIKIKKKSDGPSRTMDHSIKAAPGETLTFDLRAGGTVDIRGWDEPRVTVHSILGGDAIDQIRIDVERAANGVRIASVYDPGNIRQSSSIRFEIRAPRRINIDLESIGGGIILTDLEGTFRGNTGGGSIEIANLKGTAKLDTGGGEITVVDSDLDGSVSTGGGAVKLDRVRGGLRGSSGSGPVTYKKDNRPHIDRAGGHVRLEEAPDGASISTGGGDIEVGRASGVVEASTGGGEIRIGPVAGSVYAGTGAGDVEITIVDANGAQQNVKASTGYGRIVVNLPAGFDGQFDLETAYTESHRARIESDWNLRREPVTDWDDSEGTPRRYVRAKGSAGSGRGWVKIKAINGDVIVRKRD